MSGPRSAACLLPESMQVIHEARRHHRPLAPGGHAGGAARHRARGGQRHPRRRPRPQDRAAPAGRERRARPAARQQLARQALPEPEARRREPGLHQGAADHPRVRRGRGDPEQARALSRDPDRERAEEGHRRQADQPEHLPGAPLRAAPVRASTERTVAPGGGRLARLVQPQDRGAARLPACDRSGPAQRPGSDHGRDVPARAAGEAARSGSTSRGRPSAGRRSCRR